MAELRAKYIGKRTARRKPVSREEYILGSLERAFPTGHWVETTQDRGEGVNGPQNGSGGRTDPNSTGTAYITIIGGQKYDPALLHDALAPFIHRDRILVGAGRGVESDLVRDWDAEVVPVNPDRYGKNARKVNVEEVLCYAIDSPLLLVGNGERVKQARKWLERTNSRREVVELP